jgi:hypothetical protein
MLLSDNEVATPTPYASDATRRFLHSLKVLIRRAKRRSLPIKPGVLLQFLQFDAAFRSALVALGP